MFVNTQWFQRYLDRACTADELIDAFMRAGLEVEETYRLAEILRPVKVGFVREKLALPGADDMFLCKIDLGGPEPVPVVCASEHEIEVGWGVPVAPPGTKLPHHRHVAEGRYHGEVSRGMICLDGEMGMMARESGLRILEDESLAGRSLPEAVDIPDVLVDISVLPNRPDCLGLLGMAREVAAILGCSVVWPEVNAIELSPDDSDALSIEIEEPDACHRYIGGLVRGTRVAKSPPWLKSFLLFTGARPINSVVDVTNFVLYEWGQPLHAFDLGTIKGAGIVVRRMRKGESLALLDGTELKDATDALVIADRERPVALAGIMGGSPTQTTTETGDVLLEAACFERVGIRRTARALGLSSESSYRFERGTDPNTMLEGAFQRALSLIAELTGGSPAPPAVDRYVTRRAVPARRLDESRVSAYLGLPVERATIRTSLERLGMACDDDLVVRPPSWRVDIDDPVVLIEDVARMIGYDAVPRTTTSARPTRGVSCGLDRLRDAASGFLAGQGFLECRSLPLVAAEQAAFVAAARSSGGSVDLTNPMRTDMASARRSLLPSLIDAIETNARRGATRFRFFEIDRVFDTADGGPREGWSVAAVAGGRARDVDWSGGGGFDFYEMKGVVENLLDLAGAGARSFRPEAVPGLAAPRSAAIAAGGETVGFIGEIDPRQLRGLKLDIPIYACELSLDALGASFARVPAYRRISPFPPIARDLAVVLDEAVPFADVEAAVRESVRASLARDGVPEAERTRLAALRCFDCYVGEHVPEGKKSLALHLLFRNPTRTLTAEEVVDVVDDLVKALERGLGAQLRS